MNKQISDRLKELNLPLIQPKPFRGDAGFYNYTYVIICTAEDSDDYMRVYFGKKSEMYINNRYKGSGRRINDYHKKFPGKYYKQILGFYNTFRELNDGEYKLIHPHLGKSYCLNMKEGRNPKRP